MTLPPISDIEKALLPFRSGRRRVLDKFLHRIAEGDGIADPFLMFSRFFVRIKSADSILEKIKRKGIVIANTAEIPEKIPDILGFRIIAENMDELKAIERFLTESFEVVSRSDQTVEPTEFGYRGIEYSLRYHADGAVYPFEIQLRTFLQHYWTSQSFHLFHKQPRETALKYRDVLLSLSRVLERAEMEAKRISDSLPVHDRGNAITWKELPLRTRTHIVVVAPGEQFVTHFVQPLTGDDLEDSNAIVNQKLGFYDSHPGSAIVECSCLHFLSFALNEPQVHIPMDRWGKVVW